MKWNYKGWGVCQFCGHDDARLFALVDVDLRTVTKPLFCPSCQTKFEFFCKAMEPANALKLMNRRRD